MSATCWDLSPHFFFLAQQGGRMDEAKFEMQVRRERKRRDQLSKFAELQRQRITKRIGSKRSPTAEYKDVIYKMVGHIVRQSNYRSKERG